MEPVTCFTARAVEGQAMRNTRTAVMQTAIPRNGIKRDMATSLFGKKKS
jgi:hypothetical protein